jgi:hypothetical protein
VIRYFSDLSKSFTDELLAKPDMIYGWRLVEVAEDQTGCEYYLTRWLVEDDGINENTYMSGKRINVSFKHYDDGKINVSTRDVITT